MNVIPEMLFTLERSHFTSKLGSLFRSTGGYFLLFDPGVDF